MEIIRQGASKKRRPWILATETSPEISFDNNGNIIIQVYDKESPQTREYTYNYKIVLTKDDIGKIVAEFLSKAFQ